MNINELFNQIQQALKESIDPKRAEWAKTNYPSQLTILGVINPDLKIILKEVLKELKKEPPERTINLVKQLIDSKILENVQLAYEILDKHQKAFAALTAKETLEIRTGQDNWVLVDYYAGLIAGPKWRDGILKNEVLYNWLESENFWDRRTAVVCTVALNQKARGGTGDPKRTLDICKRIITDKNDMVAKALSWALRELAKRETEPVIQFIEDYKNVLPKRVLREVGRKLETGRKY